MRNRSVKNALTTIAQTHKASPFPVTGFAFILDTGEETDFDTYIQPEGAPIVPGFKYFDTLPPECSIIDTEVVNNILNND